MRYIHLKPLRAGGHRIYPATVQREGCHSPSGIQGVWIKGQCVTYIGYVLILDKNKTSVRNEAGRYNRGRLVKPSRCPSRPYDSLIISQVKVCSPAKGVILLVET